MSEDSSFKVGIHFFNMLRAISKQIYETPMAFIRENAQNAVDAIRIQADRESQPLDSRDFRVDVTTDDVSITIRDNGNGMTDDELRRYFWTMGASGKQTDEAKRAGCVGMFGIGGFANFGVCKKLEVISQAQTDVVGTYTSLASEDIERAEAQIPDVFKKPSMDAAPRGTKVVGWLKEPPRVDELKQYLTDFVKYVPVAVFFNTDLISQSAFVDFDSNENLVPIGASSVDWTEGDLSVSVRLWEDGRRTIYATVRSMRISGVDVLLKGQLKFEHGALDVFKRGFKLCATSIGSEIGISGRLECDAFIPTAGRDSLDSSTTTLLARLTQVLERNVCALILGSSDRLAHYTRIFRLAHRLGWVDQIGNSIIRVADGGDLTLHEVQSRATAGATVFYGTQHKKALSEVMAARGHLVLLLSADAHKQAMEIQYLERFCNAKRFTGVVEIKLIYQDLSQFENIVLAEIETVVARSYELLNFAVVAASLTEDLPAYVKEPNATGVLEVIVDVRHSEVSKLQVLGLSGLLYSVLANFAREYLGPALKRWSPRFFGDGAINLDLFAKERSELWVLVKDDIGTVQRSAERQVFTSSDVQVVNVGSQTDGDKTPKIVSIVDVQGSTGLAGYYIRLPNTAYRAYGDLIQEYAYRGVTWGGNKIGFVASDAISASFQYEIRLDQVISHHNEGVTRAEGSAELTKPIQILYGGLYFPIPSQLERFLVPVGDSAIRLQLDCDLFDIRASRRWSSIIPETQPV